MAWSREILMLVVAAAPVTTASPGLAAPLPSYDVAAHCQRVSQTTGGSYVIEKGCRDQEATAIRNIRARSIPERVWNFCNEVAGSTGGSYMIFDGCVDQELEAASSM